MATTQPSSSNLPAISRRFKIKPDLCLKSPEPTTQPFGSGFYLYCMVVVDGLMICWTDEKHHDAHEDVSQHEKHDNAQT